MSSAKRRAGKDRQSRTARADRVIVVGAGAAGLAAAAALHEAGVPSIVLEARARIGGRIWTKRTRSLVVPIELGAEFIHGEAAEVAGIADHARLRVIDIAGRRYRADGSGLRPIDDFWERLDR